MDDKLDKNVLAQIQPFQGLPDQTGDIIPGGGTLQKVETSYTTAVAVQKPRSLSTVVVNVLQEAQLAGAAFYYKWSVKTKQGPRTIQGGSIDLARSIARNFGNCVVDIEEAYETPTHFRFKSSFIDLETGLTWPRLFRQRKGQSMGMSDTERQEDIIYQIGQSKSQRNAVFQGVPGWLVSKAIEAAEKAEVEGIKSEGIEFARAKVVDYFAKYGVDRDRLEFKIGKSADGWNEMDIADLRAAATAIREGREKIEVIFPQVEPQEKPEKAKTEVKVEKEPEKPVPQDPDPSAGVPGPAPPIEDISLNNRETWIRLGAKNFKKYVLARVDQLDSMSAESLKEIKAKWARFFDAESWPQIEIGGDVSREGEPGEPPPISDSDVPPTLQKSEGEYKDGIGKTVPVESGEVSPLNSDELAATDEYLELEVLMEKYPATYLKITKGNKPNTMDSVKMAIDLIETSVANDPRNKMPDA